MGLFGRIRKTEPGWKLRTADLTECTEDIRNPGRGWYQIYTFRADEEPDFGDLEWCLDRKDALALVFFDIGAFRDRALDQAALGRMRRTLDFFCENRYDIILRVAYDHQGKAVEREPYFWDQVKAHMRQVGELLEENAGGIFVYQGLLVGNWGEMHTTRFQDERKRKELWEILREYRRQGTYAAVRRPAYWRQLHEEAQDGKKRTADMGLFDDAMFSSENHMGTFGVLSRENGWGEQWNREEELRFEEALCRDVPNGGEAVYGEEFQERLTPEMVADTLRRMHITYLNKAYDSRILDIWKQWKYAGEGAWNGKSLYEYIGAHLGYRLVIRGAKFRAAGGADSGKLEITVENTGFASMYQETDFWLESGDGSLLMNVRPEGKEQGAVWNSGERRILSCRLRLNAQELWIRANRKADGACIRFAGSSDRDGRTKIGELER